MIQTKGQLKGQLVKVNEQLGQSYLALREQKEIQSIKKNLSREFGLKFWVIEDSNWNTDDDNLIL